MRFSIRNRQLAFALCLLTFVPLADGDGLMLTSQNGDEYNYAIQLDPNHGLVFVAGDQIKLSGLSGVTGATLLSGLAPFFAAPVVAADAVTVTDLNAAVFDPVSTGITIPALSVMSSVVSAGSVNYYIQTGDGTISGSVPGPVAVPEPSEWKVCAIAVLGAFLVSRYRRFDTHNKHSRSNSGPPA